MLSWARIQVWLVKVIDRDNPHHRHNIIIYILLIITYNIIYYVRPVNIGYILHRRFINQWKINDKKKYKYYNAII